MTRVRAIKLPAECEAGGKVQKSKPSGARTLRTQTRQGLERAVRQEQFTSTKGRWNERIVQNGP